MSWGGIKRTKNDRLWSFLIRVRSGWRCEYCGDSYELDKSRLDAAHIHICPRGNWTLRNDPDAGICLCKSCHSVYDGHSRIKNCPEKRLDMREWVLKHVSRERLIRLRYAVANPTRGIKSPYMQKLIRADLESKLIEMGVDPKAVK